MQMPISQEIAVEEALADTRRVERDVLVKQKKVSHVSTICFATMTCFMCFDVLLGGLETTL